MANLNASAQALHSYNNAGAALQAAASERYRGFEGLSRFGEALLSYGMHRQKQTAAEGAQEADFKFKEAHQKRQHAHELNLLRQQGKNTVSEKNALLAAWQAQEAGKKEEPKPLVDVTKTTPAAEVTPLKTHEESGKPTATPPQTPNKINTSPRSIGIDPFRPYAPQVINLSEA